MLGVGRAGRILTVVLLSVVVAAFVSVALVSGLLRGYRASAVDALFPRGTTDPRIAIVAIDRSTLADSSQRWPWPRGLQADLVRSIAAHHPAEIVLDIVYDPSTPDDPALVAAIRDSHVPVVLAQASQLTSPKGAGNPSLSSHVAGPTRAIAAAATSVGDGAIIPDAHDAVVRLIPLVVESSRGALIPSLALAAVASLDRTSPVVVLRPHGVQIGARAIPTEPGARLRISYAEELSGRRLDAITIPAAEVLAGRGVDRLNGRIVIVGVTDPTVGDVHDTPTDKGGAAGVDIQANALNTILTRSWLAPASDLETACWILGLTVTVTATTFRRRIWHAPFVAALIGGAYIVIVSLRFDAGTEMDILYPLLGIALALGTGTAVRYAAAARDRGRMIGLLGQYVPTPVARELLTGRSRTMPSGQITFVFTDVIGSTELWEQEPRPMSVAMSKHDRLIDDAVADHRGAVVRPRGEGDSRFLVFVNANDGLLAAIDICRAMHREPWPTRLPIEVRIGVHTGTADLRADDYYGSDVNRCARIRSLASGMQVLVSDSTVTAIGDQYQGALIDMGRHELKGISQPEQVYEAPWLVTVSPAG